jgi:hypothetical protein
VSPDQIKITWVANPSARRRHLLESKFTEPGLPMTRVLLSITDMPRAHSMEKRLSSLGVSVTGVETRKNQHIAVKKRKTAIR